AVVGLIGVVGAGLVGRRALHVVEKARHHYAAATVVRSGPTWDPPALSIPTAHPRLWWTPERLARGRAWAKSHPIKTNEEEPGTLALSYVLTGDQKAGRQAVEWLKRLKVETSGVASDAARWNGEDAMLVFDWCHDL